MKKIVLGMLATVVAFSAMAQTTDKNSSEKKKFYKNEKHFDGGKLKQLNLSDDQKAQMKSVGESYKQQMLDISKSGTPEEQKAKRMALMQERREKMMAILTPEQKKQAEDAKADFKDHKKEGKHEGKFKDMTKNLDLTADQSTKVAALNEGLKTNMQNIKNNSSLTADQKKEQMKSLFMKHRSDVQSLLTSEQKVQLDSQRKNHTRRTAVK